MLEETGLPYRLRMVDITRGEQHAAEFLARNPNGRIPAIVDRDGPDGEPYALFESGAILMYLADKAGQFLPPADRVAERHTVLQWLMFQMGGIGPAFGQAFHFLHQAPDGAPAEGLDHGRDRYGAEVIRLCRVMEARLSGSAYLGGPDYSIADIAAFPWIALHRWFGLDLGATPHVQRWVEAIGARPAVRRGMDVPTRQQINA